jgi:hypothetical protein
MAHHPTALRRISGLLAVSCLALGCESDDEHLCTLLGCGPIQVTTLEVESDAPSSELTLEACFNDECGSTPPPDGTSVGRLELAKLWISATSSTASGDRVLSLSWYGSAVLSVKEGDRYAVRVKTADGTTVAESVEIAESYSPRTYPNGEGCGEGCVHVDSVRQAP